jgi:hypothetical protein
MRPSDSIAGRDTNEERRTGWRRSMIVVAAGASLTGCVVSDSTPTATTLSAKDTYNQKAWPALNTCLGCHGSQPAIDWMAPGTQDGAYQTMFGFQPPVIDLDSPESSLVLTMGKHTGPAMLPADAATVLDWIQKERLERVTTTDTPVEIGPVTPPMGAVTNVDLGHGATLSFTATAFDGDLELDNVQIATTSAKIHVVHPLFVSRPLGKESVVDEVDRYDDVDINIPAATVQPLLSATFLDFAATDPITIHFLKLEAP